MGNVLLKTVEGTAKFMAHEIKKVFTASAGTKIGYLLCKKGMDDFREMFNQDKVGGAPSSASQSRSSRRTARPTRSR